MPASRWRDDGLCRRAFPCSVAPWPERSAQGRPCRGKAVRLSVAHRSAPWRVSPHVAFLFFVVVLVGCSVQNGVHRSGPEARGTATNWLRSPGREREVMSSSPWGVISAAASSHPGEEVVQFKKDQLEREESRDPWPASSARGSAGDERGATGKEKRVRVESKRGASRLESSPAESGIAVGKGNGGGKRAAAGIDSTNAQEGRTFAPNPQDNGIAAAPCAHAAKVEEGTATELGQLSGVSLPARSASKEASPVRAQKAPEDSNAAGTGPWRRLASVDEETGDATGLPSVKELEPSEGAGTRARLEGSGEAPDQPAKTSPRKAGRETPASKERVPREGTAVAKTKAKRRRGKARSRRLPPGQNKRGSRLKARAREPARGVKAARRRKAVSKPRAGSSPRFPSGKPRADAATQRGRAETSNQEQSLDESRVGDGQTVSKKNRKGRKKTRKGRGKKGAAALPAVPGRQAESQESGDSVKASELSSIDEGGSSSPAVPVELFPQGRLSGETSVRKGEATPTASLAAETEVEDDSASRVERAVDRAAAEIDAEVGGLLEQMRIIEPPVAGLRRGLSGLLLACFLLPAFHYRESTLTSEFNDLGTQREALAGSVFFGLLLYGVKKLQGFFDSFSRQRQFRKSLARIRAAYLRKRHFALTAASVSAADRKRYRSNPVLRPLDAPRNLVTFPGGRTEANGGAAGTVRESGSTRQGAETEGANSQAVGGTGEAKRFAEPAPGSTEGCMQTERVPRPERGENQAPPQEEVGQLQEAGGGNAGSKGGQTLATVQPDGEREALREAKDPDAESSQRRASFERQPSVGDEQEGETSDEASGGKKGTLQTSEQTPLEVGLNVSDSGLPSQTSTHSVRQRSSADFNLVDDSMSQEMRATPFHVREESESSELSSPHPGKKASWVFPAQSPPLRGRENRRREKHGSAPAPKAKLGEPKEEAFRDASAEAGADTRNVGSRETGNKKAVEAEAKPDQQAGRHGSLMGIIKRKDKRLGSAEKESRRHRWGSWLGALERNLRKHVSGEPELTGRSAKDTPLTPASSGSSTPSRQARFSTAETSAASPSVSQQDLGAAKSTLGLSGRQSPRAALSVASNSNDEATDEFGAGLVLVDTRKSDFSAGALERPAAYGGPSQEQTVKDALQMAKAELLDQALDAITLRHLYPLRGILGITTVLLSFLYILMSRMGPESSRAASDTVADPAVLVCLGVTLFVSLIRLRRSTKTRDDQRALMEKRRQQKARNLLRKYAEEPEAWRQQRIRSAPMVYAYDGPRGDTSFAGGSDAPAAPAATFAEGHRQNLSTDRLQRRGLRDWVRGRERREGQEEKGERERHIVAFLGLERDSAPETPPDEGLLPQSGWTAKIMRGLRRRLKHAEKPTVETPEEGTETQESEMSYNPDLALSEATAGGELAA
ncbi:putative retinitis pigmentosa GTPase regulator [Neospora caninum Liverpool]|uniref:Putative retinitis pigmentosa GTPase regulator n=1 Tax=Neospora caninum (strain Liverpool) TaxID=572307 RepID=F0VDJ6_NEOCL|nr:putative retinitis pigmentosa GTPase regulator [Neospora caninum Liverpool]CBZ51789.1 putative retinitis pigmentosa GTPase regulator [Neospora caninum Liverpool]CEL65747.1 TPA: retinitis pigmentosa GTPase regulator, putative [Neospora caninum Liverpool]|eukprot:XP_003881822.1 putative retinitis pigmentosa GTPase regulator [Neospora caninum Liverpool]